MQCRKFSWAYTWLVYAVASHFPFEFEFFTRSSSYLQRLSYGDLGILDMFDLKFDMDSIVIFEVEKFLVQTVLIGI